jgi:hypothetical protein
MAEAVASITGIIAFCASIVSFLHSTIETVKDAPEALCGLLQRTKDIRLLLKRLDVARISLSPEQQELIDDSQL